MAKCEKILIAGFSGAGKTTLLRALEASAPDGWERFDDLDQLILRSRGKGRTRLADLIEEVGWEKFRLWERQEFEGWVKEERRGVLALGGGTLSPLLWDLYRRAPQLKFVHLDVPFAVAWERLLKDRETPRPLLARGRAELEAIYAERRRVFSELPLTLDGAGAPDRLAAELWRNLSC
jgi:shikimate kinase